MLCAASGDTGFAPPPPTRSNLFSSPFPMGPGGHRPSHLKLGGSFLLRNFRKLTMSL